MRGRCEGLDWENRVKLESQEDELCVLICGRDRDSCGFSHALFR